VELKKPVLLTRKEAADYLSLKKSTLDAWAVRGGGPAMVKMGKAVRYRLADLESFIESRIRQNTSSTDEKQDGFEMGGKNIDYLRLVKDIFGANIDPKDINISIGEIEKAIEDLDTREIFVLRGRYSGLKELGPLIINTRQQQPDTGVSTETVRQIEAKALRKLRCVFRHVSQQDITST
jgi:excisionase family DNA binding protein